MVSPLTSVKKPPTASLPFGSALSDLTWLLRTGRKDGMYSPVSTLNAARYGCATAPLPLALRCTVVKLPPTYMTPFISAKAETSLLPSTDSGPAPRPVTPQTVALAKLSARIRPSDSGVPASAIGEKMSEDNSCGRKYTCVNGRGLMESSSGAHTYVSAVFVPRASRPKPKPYCQPCRRLVVVSIRSRRVPDPNASVTPPVPVTPPMFQFATRCWLSNCQVQSTRGDSKVKVDSCQALPSAAVARRRRIPSGRELTALPSRRASIVLEESWRGANAACPVTVERTSAGVPHPSFVKAQPSRPRPMSTQPPPLVS